MQMVADRIYTPEEFLLLPDSVGYELVDGHLVARNVSEKSSSVGSRISHLLWSQVDRDGGARVYGSDLTYACFEKVRQMRRADVSLVRTDRLAGLDDPGVMPIAADLVVEVLSPNDHIYDVDRKVELYLSNGFGLVWVVNPELKIVSVHRRDGTVSKLRSDNEIAGESALPGFRCKVAEFFKI